MLILLVILFLFYHIMLLFLHQPDNRYDNIVKSPSDQYINNYKNIKKTTPDTVVVSFTTTPDRITKITPMLNSLLDQTARVDKITMNIPKECNNKIYTIPADYKKICNIYESGKDYGIGTKFIPSLLREQECGTKIILVDDDVVYGKDLIETLVRESDKHPSMCIYTGKSFKGAGGILIKPEFISKITHEKCDDKWLENNLNVDKLQIPYDKNMKYLQ